ncbi:hypothetical protein BDQ12DRAFT_722237 [Crucibulum laeve]|uniref:Uncharacterized protein n=1 Tax=Crucibulum laeve TaxID=68775 RepID=A0A5C3M1T8_9AGAR|nr:hypothetical protein BDQ12DRAFT_722237 [Crucibulum laeve]
MSSAIPPSSSSSAFDISGPHHVEFEALVSPDSNPPTTARPFSIDLSLELEHQLTEMESPPTTPAYNATAHQKTHSMDPDVLAHIVTQMRQSLTDMTKERDDLVKLLSSAHSQEASLKDALQHMTDKATDAEEQLVEARKKMKDDEEAIVMLRAKVEESRRGLMRLQTESRRQSMTPIDMSRTGGLQASFGSPPSSKRASFTPLTGSMTARPNGHRRISSVSDSNIGAFPIPDTFSTSPNSQTVFHESGNSTSPNSNPPPAASRRFSGLFGRQSPPNIELHQPEPLAAEIETLRKEMQTLRDELETTKHEMQEATEAREASEECVKTLREFIAENNIGVSEAGGSGALPSPVPVVVNMPHGTKAEARKAGAGAGWGFNLWKGDAATGSASPSALGSGATPTTAAPLTQKLGGFFSSRTGSISSFSAAGVSSPSSNATLPHLQTSTPRESMYSSSDSSSLAEPVSPGDDMHGLGSAVGVRDMGTLSEMGVTTELGKGVPVDVGGPRVVLG